MRWVKASERMPTLADADWAGDVVVRWIGEGPQWCVSSATIGSLDDGDEWLEGALVDVQSSGIGPGNHAVGAECATEKPE